MQVFADCVTYVKTKERQVGIFSQTKYAWSTPENAKYSFQRQDIIEANNNGYGAYFKGGKLITFRKRVRGVRTLDDRNRALLSARDDTSGQAGATQGSIEVDEGNMANIE